MEEKHKYVLKKLLWGNFNAVELEGLQPIERIVNSIQGRSQYLI